MTKCSVDWCDSGVAYKSYGLCNRHYLQVKAHGKAVRTRMDPNEFIVTGESALIVLFASDGTKKGEAIIDLEDLQRAKTKKWNLGSNGYVYCTQGGQNITLHRFIVNSDCQIDHKNRNPLDNRRENLRSCNRSQNEGNTEKRRNNKSGYKGVYWDGQRKKWRAAIAGKRLRAFSDPIEAAREYDRHAKEHFGEFAFLNGV